MTVTGKKMLEDELKQLKTVERPQVIQAIEEARAHGDLSENADYDAAKDRQGFIEGRIRHVSSQLAFSQVIDPATLSGDKVVFGATVDLEDQETGVKKTYQIVGEDEADLKLNKIGIKSPIARALIGKNKGDEATVRAPKGEIIYDIIEVRYQ